MQTPSGYSGTPLGKKLGLKEGFIVVLHNEPKYYLKLFPYLPEKLSFPSEWSEGTVDFIHVFCTTQFELEEAVTQYKPALKKTGMLWVSWPKGSSKITTELKRDPIRRYLLSKGLVDVKVAAVDDDWSGLKFMYRKKDR
ncbi:DUF3052 domain-containing protein [Flagellimonas myxillae]|uniref:DUF3052 domain-containing protein n=1 Tax=Flagellimonas myxillae TaxID=2942214 RepID=UPI00201F0806|nr:DUF3052 domain-containing protein [Muricauda myxillae]MCL6265947.1 DUF3052 domain-containing protein [Muricauda myxillae]